MRILAMGDFHGTVPWGLKTFVKRNKVDLVLSPGDFYGDRAHELGPILRKHRNNIKRNKYGIRNLDGLEKLVSKRKLMKLIKNFSNSGKEVLEYLNEIGLPVIIVKGNVDNQKSGLTVTSSKYPIEDLVKEFSNIEMLEYEVIEFGEYKIVGFGAKFPFLCKDNLRGYESDIRNNILNLRREEKKRLKLLVKDGPERTIILSHNPPGNTKLDKINAPSNPWHGRHVGDDILRSVIEKYQPLLNVCGHMHESQGKIRVGKTLVVNSGYGKKGEFAVLDLKGKKINVRFYKNFKTK
ncbi:MAG: metallophosphoesterase [Candidatus Aenigmarchaeota archaeon]|nr:metallophosphoesterase [Candidatus Aenigmarchaeota archaeon]